MKYIKILYKNNIISKNELKNLIYNGGYIQKILYIFQKFVFLMTLYYSTFKLSLFVSKIKNNTDLLTNKILKKLYIKI